MTRLIVMAREILGGPRDAGRASYQVVVTHCEDCGRGFQHANGDLIELDPAILEMCHCDAQNVPITRPNGVTSDGSDDATANAGKLVQARVHVGVTDELARAHASVTDELASAQEKRPCGCHRRTRQRSARPNPHGQCR